jgi:hypothetical protein
VDLAVFVSVHVLFAEPYQATSCIVGFLGESRMVAVGTWEYPILLFKKAGKFLLLLAVTSSTDRAMLISFRDHNYRVL